jgi:hypothetical protein
MLLLLLFATIVRANTPCNQLFPATGGLYNEVCMFAGNGMFSSMTFGRANKYFLLNDGNPNDLVRIISLVRFMPCDDFRFMPSVDTGSGALHFDASAVNAIEKRNHGTCLMMSSQTQFKLHAPS